MVRKGKKAKPISREDLLKKLYHYMGEVTRFKQKIDDDETAFYDKWSTRKFLGLSREEDREYSEEEHKMLNQKDEDIGSMASAMQQVIDINGELDPDEIGREIYSTWEMREYGLRHAVVKEGVSNRRGNMANKVKESGLFEQWAKGVAISESESESWGNKMTSAQRLNEFKAQGHNCDSCDTSLSDKNYAGHGSWSYKCPNCKFKYAHGGASVGEQLKAQGKKNRRDEDINEAKDADKKCKGCKKNFTGKGTTCPACNKKKLKETKDPYKIIRMLESEFMFDGDDYGGGSYDTIGNGTAEDPESFSGSDLYSYLDHLGKGDNDGEEAGLVGDSPLTHDDHVSDLHESIECPECGSDDGCLCADDAEREEEKKKSIKESRECPECGADDGCLCKYGEEEDKKGKKKEEVTEAKLTVAAATKKYEAAKNAYAMAKEKAASQGKSRRSSPAVEKAQMRMSKASSALSDVKSQASKDKKEKTNESEDKKEGRRETSSNKELMKKHGYKLALEDSDDKQYYKKGAHAVRIDKDGKWSHIHGQYRAMKTLGKGKNIASLNKHLSEEVQEHLPAEKKQESTYKAIESENEKQEEAEPANTSASIYETVETKVFHKGLKLYGTVLESSSVAHPDNSTVMFNNGQVMDVSKSLLRVVSEETMNPTLAVKDQFNLTNEASLDRILSLSGFKKY